MVSEGLVVGPRLGRRALIRPFLSAEERFLRPMRGYIGQGGGKLKRREIEGMKKKQFKTIGRDSAAAAQRHGG